MYKLEKAHLKISWALLLFIKTWILLSYPENISCSKSKKGNTKIDPAKMVFKKRLSLLIPLQYGMKYNLEFDPFLNYRVEKGLAGATNLLRLIYPACFSSRERQFVVHLVVVCQSILRAQGTIVERPSFASHIRRIDRYRGN
jgi:hypothetical protein